MEIRKVQLTGGSSYIVTLPKAWIDKLGIKVKDPLGIIVQPDDSLLITAHISEEKQQRTKYLTVTPNENPAFFFRSLIGAYIAGFSMIQVTSADNLPLFVRDEVNKFLHMTIGQAIVDETEASIRIRDLLNPTEMPLETTIRRMHTIVKGMCTDAILALKDSNEELANSIISRDDDVDQLHWLIARQHYLALNDPNLARKMKVPILLATKYSKISKSLERIGDHAVKMAESTLEIISLLDKERSKSILDRIKSANEYSLSILDESIHSFLKRDMRRANESIESLGRLRSQCKEIHSRAMRQEGVVAIAIDSIVESVGRIGEYAEDISESVIDYIISEEADNHS
ncbi:MAG: PhoU domain-containing protein [Candidatus Thorarchaeota archaeon]